MTPRELPILFSDPMVRAILAGLKTQTRRVVRTSPDGLSPRDLDVERCPFGGPGDRLYVREAAMLAAVGPEFVSLRYRSDPDMTSPREVARRPLVEGTGPLKFTKWTPAIHLPRWASRITLEVAAVRAERLQKITEADAIAEGIETPRTLLPKMPTRSTREAWADLWDSLNRARAPWSSDPYVWVVTFKVLA